jgi:cell division GTPase FtsZ
MRHKRPLICEENSEVGALVSTGMQSEENCHLRPIKGRSDGSTRYAWIGTGQCGGRLVQSFYDLGYQKVLAIDTSGHDLNLLHLPQSQKFVIGNGHQMQAATDIEEATRAVKQHRQNILHLARQTFATEVDRIMICCGAGGNTAGASVTELIEIARRYARYIGMKNPSRNVGVIMTLPTSGEVRSPQVARNAYGMATTLCRMAAAGEISPLIIVDNQKADKTEPGTTAQSHWVAKRQADFSGINNAVASVFDAFNRLSSLSSPYTCLDPADYDSIMSSGGCLIMGAAEVDRLDDTLGISKAVEDSLQTPLFAGGEDLSTAKVAGCVVVGGHELMAHIKGLQDNIDYAFDILSDVTDRATAYRGIYEDYMDGLSVYTIIGGLDTPEARLKELDIDPGPQSETADKPQKRHDEILASAQHLLAEQADAHDGRVKTLSPDTSTLLASYSWPSNGQELADAIKHAYEATGGSQIPPEALPFEIIYADMQLYSVGALPILEKVKLRMAGKAYDEFLRNFDENWTG